MKSKNQLILGFLSMTLLCAASPTWAKDVRMFVRHEVADYAVWKKGYDDFAPNQKKMGVIFKAVYQTADNPNDVTVIHDFHSLEKAKAFAASPELKADMERLGVKGQPQIWITNKGSK